MSKEVMQQALEALENSVDLVREDAYEAEKLYGNYPTRQGKVGGLKVLADDHEKAITALQEALAEQPAQQEPVQRYSPDGEGGMEIDSLGAWVKFTFPQPASQEPVAWMSPSWIDPDTRGWQSDSFESIPIEGWLPLYTSPPAQRTWVSLTEDEISLIVAECSLVSPSDHYFAEAIEAKLKEKNT
jgi:hypothetical protein